MDPEHLGTAGILVGLDGGGSNMDKRADGEDGFSMLLRVLGCGDSCSLAWGEATTAGAADGVAGDKAC